VRKLFIIATLLMGLTPGAGALAAGTDDLVARGTVVASHARWTADGGRIVTVSTIRRSDGSTIAIRQAGGVIGGIGMRVFPAPAIVGVGDQVVLRLRPRSDASWSVREVINTAPPSSTRIGDLPPLGYVRTVNSTGAQLYWASGCAFITYDSAGTSHLAGDQEFDIMDAALQTWRSSTEPCAYIAFAFNPPESDREVGFDRVNLMKFRDTKWCKPATADEPEDCYESAAAALTTLFFVDDDDSDRNGEILDSDIELNGVNFSISSQGSSLGSPPCMSDLRNTFTHEVGHVLGLDHTCWTNVGPQPVDGQGNPVPSCGGALPPLITEATMFNYQVCGEESKSTLESDDIAGICEIYPLADNPNECSEVSNRRGCCAVAGERGAPASWFPLLLFAAAALILRRRRPC
jgi:MYXO-CTERM domain-containing protein